MIPRLTSPRKVSPVSTREESQHLPPSAASLSRARPRPSQGGLKGDAALAVGDRLCDPGGAHPHRHPRRADAGPGRAGISGRPDPLALGDHAVREPGDSLRPDLRDRPRLLGIQDARALGPGLRASPGADPDGAPGPLAAVDPAWRPPRGPRRRVADARACPGVARAAVRPWAAAGPSAAAALQRVAPPALGALRAWRRRALRRGRGRDPSDHRCAPGRILDQRQRLSGQRAAILARRRHSLGRPAVPPLLRAARPVLQLRGRERVSPRPGGAGALPLARGAGALRRRPGLHEPAVLRGQERRLDHLPLGRLARRRPTPGARCGLCSG